jgi:hypothetical protein
MSKARLQETEMGEAMVIHLVREGYWNNLEAFCNDSYKRTSDPLYLFWHGFALHQLGNTAAAINDLLSIHQKKEIAYASIVALLYYQAQARNIDRVLIPSSRKKSTTYAHANEKNAAQPPNEPSPLPFISSPSSRSSARPPISSRKRAPPTTSESPLLGPISSCPKRKGSPARQNNSSTNCGRKKIKISPKQPSFRPEQRRET